MRNGSCTVEEGQDQPWGSAVAAQKQWWKWAEGSLTGRNRGLAIPSGQKWEQLCIPKCRAQGVNRTGTSAVLHDGKSSRVALFQPDTSKESLCTALPCLCLGLFILAFPVKMHGALHVAKLSAQFWVSLAQPLRKPAFVLRPYCTIFLHGFQDLHSRFSF